MIWTLRHVKPHPKNEGNVWSHNSLAWLMSSSCPQGIQSIAFFRNHGFGFRLLWACTCDSRAFSLNTRGDKLGWSRIQRRSRGFRKGPMTQIRHLWPWLQIIWPWYTKRPGACPRRFNVVFHILWVIFYNNSVDLLTLTVIHTTYYTLLSKSLRVVETWVGPFSMVELCWRKFKVTGHLW